MKFTKIVATIGPASSSRTTLRKMVKAGMNVVRLNFSHGDYDSFDTIIRNIRAIEKETKQPIAIIQDLQGPKIRLGVLPPSGLNLKEGQKVILIAGVKSVTGKKSAIAKGKSPLSIKTGVSKQVSIPVQYPALAHDIHKDDLILLHDGLVELKVIKKSKDKIFCRVLKGGLVETHHGLHVPTASLSASPLTPKDLKDLEFGLAKNVDFIALSFVRNSSDITRLKKIITKHKSNAKVIAKIERHEAITNLEDIIKATDAVMVARGDLGVDMPFEQLPILQKKIIYMANQYGKPVITATEMLQSMINAPRPTRAEISDVANAVLDHTDAVMLSNESAVGKYPVDAVETLTKVAKAMELALTHEEPWLLHLRPDHRTIPCTNNCASVAVIASQLNARAIVVIANNMTTVAAIAKHHVPTPIIVITSKVYLRTQLPLMWGVEKVIVVKSLHSLTSRAKIFTVLKNHKITLGSKDSTVIIKERHADFYAKNNSGSLGIYSEK